MSKTTELLEAAVAGVIANRFSEGERPGARQRLAADRAFASVMKIIAPRIRHFIRQYGLVHHREDAEQVCAIGVHRAIEAYDPDKAMFTTFVNWQIRGELQALRFRLMDDQRASAKKVGAITISLHGVEYGPEGEEMPLEALIEDEAAASRTEACAADHMVARLSEALLDEYVRHLWSIGMAQLKRKARDANSIARRKNSAASLAKYAHSGDERIDPDELRKLEERINRDRDIVSRHLFGNEEDGEAEGDQGLTRERIRQITRRAARLIGELAADNPRFYAAMQAGENDSKADETPASSLWPRGCNRMAESGVTRVTEPDPIPMKRDPFLPSYAAAGPLPRH